jgi:hypothetical protein
VAEISAEYPLHGDVALHLYLTDFVSVKFNAVFQIIIDPDP